MSFKGLCRDAPWASIAARLRRFLASLPRSSCIFGLFLGTGEANNSSWGLNLCSTKRQFSALSTSCGGQVHPELGRIVAGCKVRVPILCPLKLKGAPVHLDLIVVSLLRLVGLMDLGLLPRLHKVRPRIGLSRVFCILPVCIAVVQVAKVVDEVGGFLVALGEAHGPGEKEHAAGLDLRAQHAQVLAGPWAQHFGRLARLPEPAHPPPPPPQHETSGPGRQDDASASRPWSPQKPAAQASHPTARRPQRRRRAAP